MIRPGRRSSLRRLAGWLLTAAVVAGVAACASAPPGPGEPVAGPMPGARAAGADQPPGQHVEVPLQLGDAEVRAHWYLPARAPDLPQAGTDVLLVLQHGFSRRCGHLRETSALLMATGVTVLCLDAPMAGGNPVLAATLGDALARALAAPSAAALPGDLAVPDGRPMPPRVVVGGHSAGARFAVALGDRLLDRAPRHVAGALLFDPVATAGFGSQLSRLADAGRRPVLAVFAPAHGCNARLNAWPDLLRVRREALDAGRDGFVGILLTDGATHADVEGEDTDWLAAAACGRPVPANVAIVRAAARAWVLAVQRGEVPTVSTVPAGDGWRVIE